MAHHVPAPTQMLKTVRSLQSTGAQITVQADGRLLETQTFHANKHKAFQQEVEEQQRIDRNNVRLLTEAIDQLERLLITEKDLQKSELDPLLEEMNAVIDDKRQEYVRRVDELSSCLKGYQVEVQKSMDIFDSALQRQIEKRTTIFSAMQQEFLRSMDDITSQFRIEEEERAKQADSIEQSLNAILGEHQGLIEAQQELLTQQLEEVQDQHTFDAKMVQNIGVKKFTSVHAQIETIQQQNVEEQKDRTQLEEKIADEIETIAQKVKSGLDVYGKQE